MPARIVKIHCKYFQAHYFNSKEWFNPVQNKTQHKSNFLFLAAHLPIIYWWRSLKFIFIYKLDSFQLRIKINKIMLISHILFWNCNIFSFTFSSWWLDPQNEKFKLQTTSTCSPILVEANQNLQFFERISLKKSKKDSSNWKLDDDYLTKKLWSRTHCSVQWLGGKQSFLTITRKIGKWFSMPLC